LLVAIQEVIDSILCYAFKSTTLPFQFIWGGKSKTQTMQSGTSKKMASNKKNDVSWNA
jgi:hypothetical protein